MLSYKTIEPHTLELLKSIMKESLFSDMRLVGGTALALQYGHRQSVDLYVFGKIPENSDAMEDVLSGIGDLQIIKVSERIRIYFIDKIKVDFVDYSRYPWIDSPVEEHVSWENIKADILKAVDGYKGR